MARAKNTVSGVITTVPSHYIGHPILGKNLVAIDGEVEAAPNNETVNKEQPAPKAKSGKTEPESTINENKE